MSRLRIATFNLESFGDDGDAQPSTAERIAALRPQLLRLDADLLCLQEVNAQHVAPHRPRTLSALDTLLEQTPYASYARVFTIGPRGDGPADRHNLVVLSRRPIEATRQIRHDHIPPLSYRPATATPPAAEPIELSWDRPILYVTLRLEAGRRLHLLNLHLKAPVAAVIAGQKLAAERWKTVGGWAEGFFLASTKRAGQALEARLVIEAIFDAEPDPLIAVCGDFNADDHEVPVKIIRGDAEGAVDPAGAARRLSPLEWSVAEPRRFSIVHAGRPQMLDHILVSRALANWPHRLEIHNEGLHDEALWPAAGRTEPGSYHAPVVAEFALPE